MLVRKDLLHHKAQTSTPGILDWALLRRNECLWNTPATFNIYVTGLVVRWIEEEEAWQRWRGGQRLKSGPDLRRNRRVRRILCDAGLLELGLWRFGALAQRSRMNVPFVVRGAKANGADGRSAAERDTMEERATASACTWGLQKKPSRHAHKHTFRLWPLCGRHCTNAVSVDDAKVLAQFMREFQDQYRAARASVRVISVVAGCKRNRMCNRRVTPVYPSASVRDSLPG